MRGAKSYPPTERQIACLKRMREALDPALEPEEMLALACQLVGNLIALQDQRKYTTNAVMAMVSANIEVGNREAIREVASAGGEAN